MDEAFVRCADCVFWEWNGPEICTEYPSKYKWGRCHLMAPVRAHEGIWPQTREVDWCGEGKAKNA